MPFCPRCGSEVKPDVNFCSSCGHSMKQVPLVPPPPPPPFPQPITTAERVIGVIPHLLQREPGHIGSKHFTLIATNRRLIVAQFTVQMIREAQADSKRRAKEGGKGFLGRLFAGAFIASDYADRYWNMSPDLILLETPGNIAVEIPKVSAVVIEHHVNESEDSRFDVYELSIESAEEAFSYVFDGDPEDVKMLRQILGDRVHGSGAPRVIRLGRKSRPP